jgi:hypothetical protein
LLLLLLLDDDVVVGEMAQDTSFAFGYCSRINALMLIIVVVDDDDEKNNNSNRKTKEEHISKKSFCFMKTLFLKIV